MLAWSFPCKTADEVSALLRALGKHRYLREADHRLHWMLDAALRDEEPFASQARAFEARRAADPSLDPSSYDPALWRPVSAEDLARVLTAFWEPGPRAAAASARLLSLVAEHGLPLPEHAPFEGDPEYPDHPALVQLGWTLHAIEDLDAERHAGALAAMEAAGEEVDMGAAVEQEGPDLGVAELTRGAPRGVLTGEFLIWADGPYSYNDYVFRGACKVAKLPDPPEGLRDLDD